MVREASGGLQDTNPAASPVTSETGVREQIAFPVWSDFWTAAGNSSCAPEPVPGRL